MDLNILDIIDEGKCYEQLRLIRWSADLSNLKCLSCDSQDLIRNGYSDVSKHIRRYKCKCCHTLPIAIGIDDRTGTPFSGSHQMLKVWLLVLYFMGLNLSNKQIASELNLVLNTCNRMVEQLRTNIVCNQEEPILEKEVEIDEVYIVAGHKGQPEKVKELGRDGRRRRLKGARGRGTLENEKPPILGIVQRKGCLIMRVLPNVKQVTIRPIIERHIKKQTLIYTDEYNIYARLTQWDYQHKTVCHSKGEYARDESR